MPEYRTEPKDKSISKLFKELLAALHALQKFGLVHCDISPHNIMWNDDDDLVVRQI